MRFTLPHRVPPPALARWERGGEVREEEEEEEGGGGRGGETESMVCAEEWTSREWTM